MQERWRVDQRQGKEGSTVKIKWDAERMKSFDDTKAALCRGPDLQNGGWIHLSFSEWMRLRSKWHLT